MNIEVVQGVSHKPVAGQELVHLVSEWTESLGKLFIGYPIIGTPEGRHQIDALLVTPNKGLVVFDLIEGPDPGDYGSRQDDSANKLEAKLKAYRELMRGRQLPIEIHTISFAPGITHPESLAKTGYQLVTSSSLLQALTELKWEQPSEEVYERALSAIESISTIRKSATRRAVVKEDSRGGKLKRLEDSIATLDNRQSKAVIETVEGVQRIRGLAGSGKTIVLALKAAYLHAQNPEWRIGVTFHTRSLKGHFRRLIEKFTLEHTGEEPDWNNLQIIHAWGAPGGGDRDGIYHQFCRTHEIDYFDFIAARNRFGQGVEFARVCEHALSQASDKKPIYEVLLVDEAQDFAPPFLRVCYELLGDSKRLVYAYDELQSLSGESLPSPEDIFGTKADGTAKVRFDGAGPNGPQRDVILPKCYRNSRPVLVTAHALGFGIYREPQPPSETGLIQMFDYPQLWEEIGYRRRHGELQEGSSVILYRPEETSPKFLEDHSDIDDLIQFISCDSEEEQAARLVEAIRENLAAGELRHDDIVVINPNPLSTRRAVGPIRARLLELGINSHLAGVDTGPDTFFLSNMESVTFTGVYRAKGNETGMVYIINAQDCHSTAWNLATIRNWLFTAITRSKSWVRVLGVGSRMTALQTEFERLKQQHFELNFIYPTQMQREQLRIVHRDMTRAERKRVESRQRGLEDLIKELETGDLHVEDLDKGVLDRLKGLLDDSR